MGSDQKHDAIIVISDPKCPFFNTSIFLAKLTWPLRKIKSQICGPGQDRIEILMRHSSSAIQNTIFTLWSKCFHLSLCEVRYSPQSSSLRNKFFLDEGCRTLSNEERLLVCVDQLHCSHDIRKGEIHWTPCIHTFEC